MVRKKSLLTSVVLIFIGIMMLGCSMEQSSEPQVSVGEQSKEVKAVAVGSGYTSSMIIDETGRVWVCGDEINQFQRIERLKNIKMVSGRAEKVVALDNKGEVWVWNGAPEGVEDGKKEEWAAEPVKIKNLSAITAIAGNQGTYLALKNDGTVYAWGDNMYQQLGLYRDNRDFPEPVPDLPPAISISCGGSYCAAVDQEGYVWVWGEGIDLNLRVIHGVYYPQKVSGMDQAVSVSCSMGGIIALRKDGSVWEWGNDDNPPHKIEGPEKVEKIFQGGFHGLCNDKEGNLWIWGSNKKGQLGNGEAKWAYFSAAKVNSIANVVSISGGVRHTIVCLKDGSVWTWGDNSMGQLGNGTYENSSVPQKICPLTIQP